MTSPRSSAVQLNNHSPLCKNVHCDSLLNFTVTKLKKLCGNVWLLKR